MITFHPLPGDKKPVVTQRQLEVLYHASRGKTAEQTALLMGVSHETARKHRKRAMARLEAASMANATAKAVALGIIRPEWV